MASTDDLKDLDQVLVREVSRQGGDGLHEVEGTRLAGGTLGWENENGRPWSVSSNVN